ncbi:hypothetical protein RRG08_039415 [Elysia crispata]|uniref:PIN domain-containing protein n=1 Tax=Elysia crispata TaxID=231223 RepID=A0AAE1AAN2_9GAST|nr:hypothetical protein RRG08_039415 [Elysia crispata]
MNDDKILHCCLQYQKKFPSSQLCLMTRDINLRNKAVIMGIDATNDNDLWSYLDNSSTVRKTGNVNLTNPLRETVSANMFVKEGTIPDEFIEKRNTSSTEKLNKQRRNERNRGVAEAITKILTGFPSSSNSGSKADSEVIRQQQVHTTEEASTVFSKFESVWKFVFNIKNQLNQILSSGKAEDEFDEAVKTLKTMSFLVSDLCCIYNSCLTVSPVILHNHPSQFEKLCSALNSFVTLSGVVNTDLNSPVRLDPMMAYFKETKNRILLMSGLEQMKNFSSEFLDMMNTLTSTRHVV